MTLHSPEVGKLVENTKKKRRRQPPWPERLKVWTRSGGRCAMCGEFLLEGKITKREFALGELAHIVGQQNSAGSPRGQVAMSDEDRDKAANLMLVCAGEHVEIDRDGALDVLNIEKLQSIKRSHEDWIRQVTGLERNRGTAVLRMIGQLHGDSVDLSKPQATDAVLQSDNRFPEFPLCHEGYGLEIDLRHLPGESHGKSYWDAGVAKIDEVVNHKLKDAVTAEKVKHLSVFALARLPLVVCLGSKLDDTFEVEIYQRHRSSESWLWPDHATTARFEISAAAGNKNEECTLILNVSGTINSDELPAATKALPAYELSVADQTATVDTIASRASVKAFDRSIRELLSLVEANQKTCRRMHVFGALPISACIALGRAHDPHVHPNLVIYERYEGTYREALTIS